MIYVCLFALLTSSALSDMCMSWRNCPSQCGANTTESDILAVISRPFHVEPSSNAYYDNVKKVINILKTFGKLKSNDQLYLHATIAYLCCYSIPEYADKLIPAMKSVKWLPLNITFDRLVCNFDSATSGKNTTKTVSLILLLSTESQKALGAVVDQFEAAMRKTGLPIVPRKTMEPFHSTIAVVNSGYPVDAAIAEVNKQMTDWTSGLGPIIVHHIISFLPPYVLDAIY